MKFTRAFRTATVAAAMAFAATTASAQEPAAHQGHTDMAPPHADVTGRVAQLDERIALLTADTRMFAGEMKIQVMTELIEALIERQYLMERRMRPMHEMKNERMPHSKRPVRPGTMPESEEMSPETMCSPYI